LFGDERPDDWLRRSPLPDLLIAGELDIACERRVRDANRAVWSSFRDFKVISRNLGHGLSQYAAAMPARTPSFTKIPRKYLLTGHLTAVSAGHARPARSARRNPAA
jgi:hypothetical protein